MAEIKPTIPHFPNAFMLYSKSRRRELTKNMPGMHQSEISKILGIEWSSLAPSRRASFFHESEQLRHSCGGTNLSTQKKKRRRPTVNPITETDQVQKRLAVPNNVPQSILDSIRYPALDLDGLTACQLPRLAEYGFSDDWNPSSREVYRKLNNSSPRSSIGEFSRSAFEESDKSHLQDIPFLQAQVSPRLTEADALENLPLGWYEIVYSPSGICRGGTSTASLSRTSMTRTSSSCSSESDPCTIASVEEDFVVPSDSRVFSNVVSPPNSQFLNNSTQHILCRREEPRTLFSLKPEVSLPESVSASHFDAGSRFPSGLSSRRTVANQAGFALKKDVETQITDKVSKRDAETQTAETLVP